MFIIAWYVRAAGLVGFDIWKNSWSGNGNQLSTRRLENKQCFSFNSICCALVSKCVPLMLRLRIRFPKNSNMFNSCVATFMLFGTLLINARGHILQNSEKIQG